MHSSPEWALALAQGIALRINLGSTKAMKGRKQLIKSLCRSDIYISWKPGNYARIKKSLQVCR